MSKELTEEQKEKRRKKKKQMEQMVLEMNSIFPEANFQDLIQSVVDTKGSSIDEAMNFYLNNFLGKSQEKEIVEKKEEPKKVETVVKKKKEELEEDDSCFIKPDEEKKEVKEEVSKTLDIEKVISKQFQQVEELSSTLNLPVSICGNLLRHFKWKEEKLLNEYFADPDSLYKKCGLDPKSILTPFYKGSKDEMMECSVCMDDLTGDQMYSLSCNHLLCKNCWKGFLKNAVNNEGPSCLNKNCPYPKCTMICNEPLFKEILDQEDFYKYSTYIKNSLIDDNPNLKWCPNSLCGKIVSIQSKFLRSVTCKCGESYCFDCLKDPHDPLSCENYDEWMKDLIKKIDDYQLVNLGVKKCPKCKANIEKNGGCNYMACTCGYEFCWECLEYHNHYDHVCFSGNKKENFIPSELYSKMRKKYKMHNKSQALEYKSIEKLKEKIDVERITKNEGNYLEIGFKRLKECRNVLKWSYPYLYFCKDEKEKNLMEFSLVDLENYTERLSYFLENKPLEEKNTIISLTKLAESKIDYVLNGV